MPSTEPKTVNPAGNPKIIDTPSRKVYTQRDTKMQNSKDEPNPHHREDLERLLRGIARSSE